MYIAGRLRTASRPSRTVIDSALYSAFAFAKTYLFLFLYGKYHFFQLHSIAVAHRTIIPKHPRRSVNAERLCPLPVARDAVGRDGTLDVEREKLGVKTQLPRICREYR